MNASLMFVLNVVDLLLIIVDFRFNWLSVAGMSIVPFCKFFYGL